MGLICTVVAIVTLLLNIGRDSQLAVFSSQPSYFFFLLNYAIMFSVLFLPKRRRSQRS